MAATEVTAVDFEISTYSKPPPLGTPVNFVVDKTMFVPMFAIEDEDPSDNLTILNKTISGYYQQSFANGTIKNINATRCFNVLSERQLQAIGAMNLYMFCPDYNSFDDF